MLWARTSCSLHVAQKIVRPLEGIINELHEKGRYSSLFYSAPGKMNQYIYTILNLTAYRLVCLDFKIE